MITLCRITDHDTKSVYFHTTMYSDEVKAKDIAYSKIEMPGSLFHCDLQHWKSNGLFGE